MGAHTDFIEATCGVAKASMCESSREKAHILGNLTIYMFLRQCMDRTLDETKEFVRLALAKIFMNMKNAKTCFIVRGRLLKV